MCVLKILSIFKKNKNKNKKEALVFEIVKIDVIGRDKSEQIQENYIFELLKLKLIEMKVSKYK